MYLCILYDSENREQLYIYF